MHSSSVRSGLPKSSSQAHERLAFTLLTSHGRFILCSVSAEGRQAQPIVNLGPGRGGQAHIGCTRLTGVVTRDMKVTEVKGVLGQALEQLHRYMRPWEDVRQSGPFALCDSRGVSAERRGVPSEWRAWAGC